MVLMVNFPYFLSNIFLSGSNFVIFVLKCINGTLLSIFAKNYPNFMSMKKCTKNAAKSGKSPGKPGGKVNCRKVGGE